MRILIDIGHPAHVHYFRNFIKIMELKGHTFFVSARNRSIIPYLLNNYQIEFWDRGKGYNNIFGKIFYMLIADLKLLRKSLQFKPDVFLSFASPYVAQVAWIIGKPNFVLDDTEHTRFAPFFYRPLSQVILNPSCYQKRLGQKQILFNSFTELFYLHKKYFTPNYKKLEILGLQPDKKVVLLRFVSWKALHDAGHKGLDLNTKRELISLLEKKGYEILISNEDENIDPLFKKYTSKIPPELIHDVISHATLFISEGGTMASESAILGTPVVYVNSLPIMGYLKEEQNYELIYPFSSSFGVVEKVEELLLVEDLKQKCEIRKNKLLERKIDATEFLVWIIEEYPMSLTIMKENPEYQMKFISS